MGNCSTMKSRYTFDSDEMKKYPEQFSKSASQLKASKSDNQNISEMKEPEIPKPQSKSIKSPSFNSRKDISPKSSSMKGSSLIPRRDNTQTVPSHTRIPVPISTINNQKARTPDNLVNRSLDISLGDYTSSNNNSTVIKQSTTSYDSGFDSNRSSCITNHTKLSSVEENNQETNSSIQTKTVMNKTETGTSECKELSSQNIVIKNPFKITGPIKRPQSLSCESEQLINRLNRSSTTDESSGRLSHSIRRPGGNRSSMCSSVCMDNPSVMYDISYLKLMLYKLRRLLTEEGDDKNLEEIFVSDSLFRDGNQDFQNEDVSRLTKEELEQKYRLLVERNIDLEKSLKYKDRTIAKLNSQKNSANHEQMNLLRDSNFKNQIVPNND